MDRTLVVYDERFGFYGDIAEAVSEKIEDDIVFVEWDNPVIQDIIRSRFGKPAFVFLVFEDDTMYVGHDGIEKFCDVADISESSTKFVSKIYGNFSGPIGKIIHGREPADRHGIYDIKSDEKEKIRELIIG